MQALRTDIRLTDFRAAWRQGVAAAMVLAALVGCGGGEQATARSDAQAAVLQQPDRLDALDGGEVRDPLLVQIKTVAREPAAQRVPARLISLPPLARTKADATAQQPGQPMQIGVAREVAETTRSTDVAPLLNWTLGPDGSRRAAIALRSAGARAVRLGLRIEQLPPGVLLNVYADGASDAIEVHAAEVMRTIQRNLDAGASGDDAYTYWLPTVDGDQAVLEVQVPAGVEPELLKIAMPRISHLLMSPRSTEEFLKVSGSCNIDVMCTSGNDAKMRAVALMQYAKGGASYVCSGTLMNNKRQDRTPYFLSAYHCISSQAVASTLETYWNYRSTSCNSGQRSGELVRVAGGAQLLWAVASNDSSFMRLNGTPPSNVVFSGWDGNAVSGTGSISSIHHPAGDLQKYSQGTTVGFRSCQLQSDGTSLCGVATAGTGTFLGVQWSQGVTEGGSSGGPLFSSSGAVIGQLLGGSSSCANPSGVDIYGRFDLAFNAGLKTWLAPTDTPAPVPEARSPVYRFYNLATGAHFYTNNVGERDFVIANYRSYQYEGPVFLAATQPAAGLSPVFRFYNAATNSHFYTVDAGERDFVIATYPTYKYEGPAWYAQLAAGGTASPMYRFYNTARNTHFYTISAAEANNVRNTMPAFTYEGVAYYAWLQ